MAGPGIMRRFVCIPLSIPERTIRVPDDRGWRRTRGFLRCKRAAVEQKFSAPPTALAAMYRTKRQLCCRLIHTFVDIIRVIPDPTVVTYALAITPGGPRRVAVPRTLGPGAQVPQIVARPPKLIFRKKISKFDATRCQILR